MINSDEILLPGTPKRFASFTFPVTMDEITTHADEDFYDWFFKHAEIVKTLFTYTHDLIPKISYIAEYENAYFLLTNDIHLVEGRFPSIKDVLEFTKFDEIGKQPLAAIDFVRPFNLDREPDDNTIDYISDSRLYDWIEQNGEFYTRLYEDVRVTETYFYEIYEVLDGFFILDPFEKSVWGKFSSFDAAANHFDNVYFDG